MPPAIRGVTFALLLAWTASAVADGKEPFDFTQSESPKRPAPDWVKMVDQGKNNETLKGYFTPTGVKLEIVADFPTVRNPVGMAFSLDGTPYVIEWTRGKEPSISDVSQTITYKDGSKRDVLLVKKTEKDVVKRLVWNKDKGVYDQAKVVLEDELPSSILFHDGWLYIAGQGTVRRYRQSKADGPFDTRQVIAQGFAGYGRNQVSGLTIGNDGRLYFTAGSGDNYVEATDGSLASALGSGAVFRCKLDSTGGAEIETWAQGFCNPRGSVAFDAAFNMFHVDSGTDDGSKFQGCRLIHVVETADYGWRLLPGARENRPDHLHGAVFGELRGRLPPMLKAGRGLPAGLMIYNDDRFPDRYRGLVFYPDPLRGSIRAYRLTSTGTTFELDQEFELLTSDDPLFQPCQMLTGPDGAMYVVDRRSTTHPDAFWGDGEHGHIYRLTWAGVEGEPVLEPRPLDCLSKVSGNKREDLLKALESEALEVRLAAQREMVSRGDKERATLIKLLADDDKPLAPRLAALGALQSLWNADVEALLCKLLADQPSALSRLAADALALHTEAGNEKVHRALLESLSSFDLPVRRSVALALGRIAGPGAYDNLASSFSFDDGKDPFLSDAYLRAIERGGKGGLERLLALGDSGDQKLTDRVAEAFLGLRSRGAAALLPQLLQSPHLNGTQRAAVLRSFSNYRTNPPIGLTPMIDYLEKEGDDDADLRLAGLEVLASVPNVKLDTAEPLVLKYLKDGDAKVCAAAVEAVIHLRMNKAVPDMVKMVGDGSRTTTERVALVRALGLLGDTGDKAVPAALRDVLDGESKVKRPALLRAEALHALSIIDPDAAQAIAKGLVDDEYRPVQVEALRALGNTPKGAREVGKMATKVEFSQDLFPQVLEVLQRHAPGDAEVAKLLEAVTRDQTNDRMKVDQKSLEKLQADVRKNGDSKHGRRIFVDCGCASCHRLEGLGRSIGPDLTGVATRLPFEKLVAAVLEPGTDIRDGFHAYTAVTKKGQTFSGLRISQTADDIVLRESTGRDVRLLTKDITEVAPAKKSFMPRNLCCQLTMEGFTDLLAFLTSAPAQEKLRGVIREFNVIGPFQAKLDDATKVEQKPDPDAAYKDEKFGDKLSWQNLQVEPDGRLNLRFVFASHDVSAYALTYIYSPKAQKARLLFGAGCTARVWINDEMIHEWADAQVPQPDKTSLNVDLQEGWNSVLVKVTSCAVCHGLYLRVEGGEGIKVSHRPDTK